MKRKTSSKVKVKEQKDKSLSSTGLQIKLDGENQWRVHMSQAATLFCCGCFSIAVNTGTVCVRGSLISKENGSVPVASYSGSTCFKLTVPAQPCGGPLVLSHISTSSFTLRALTPYAEIGESLEKLHGVFEEPTEKVDPWEEVVERITDPEEAPAKSLRILICGSKKSGKSTMSRYVINSLLSRHKAVRLLECDCGQPQFGPPCFVSLTTVCSHILLPPHCLLEQPDHMLMIGNTSPQNNPLAYISAITKLVSIHAAQANTGAAGDGLGTADVPLVINTMGWIKGFGESLLQDILLNTQPSHIISLETGNPNKDVLSFPDPLPPHPGPLEIICLPCLAALDCSSNHQLNIPAHGTPDSQLLVPRPLSLHWMCASEERSGRMHAWLLHTLHTRDPERHSNEGMLQAAFSGKPAEAAEWLCCSAPVVLDLAAIAVVPVFETWHPSHTATVLTGSFVALLDDPALRGNTSEQMRMKIMSEPAQCCGMALVHCVDMSQGASGVAYVHTPVPLERLQHLVALCVGALEVPAAFLGAHGHTSPCLSLHCLPSDAAGASTTKGRKSIPRAGQL